MAQSKQDILKARAQALARPAQSAPVAAEFLEVVEFSLARERYALTSDLVCEVGPLKDLTPLPCVPPFVAGLINLRGRIVAVIDLKKFFDLPDPDPTQRHMLLVLGSAPMELAILADEVHGVRPVRRTDILPTLPTLRGLHSDFLQGITRDQVVILDGARILSDPRIVVREEVEP